MKKILTLCLLGLSNLANADYVDLYPAKILSIVYTHSGSEATHLDNDGNPAGSCVYWSNKLLVGGRGVTAHVYYRMEKSDCTWDKAGNLIYVGPMVTTTPGRQFTIDGTYSDDGHKLIIESYPDGEEVGRTIVTAIGFYYSP